MKTKEELEEQIEIAADGTINEGDDHACAMLVVEGFIIGAKSEAAREYWQQGMYSEEEVRRMLNQCCCLANEEAGFNEQN